ncbi:hypothetical protein ABPG75_008329 [Micractinium tetrahymenae]
MAAAQYPEAACAQLCHEACRLLPLGANGTATLPPSPSARRQVQPLQRDHGSTTSQGTDPRAVPQCLGGSVALPACSAPSSRRAERGCKCRQRAGNRLGGLSPNGQQCRWAFMTTPEWHIHLDTCC